MSNTCVSDATRTAWTGEWVFVPDTPTPAARGPHLAVHMAERGMSPPERFEYGTGGGRVVMGDS